MAGKGGKKQKLAAFDLATRAAGLTALPGKEAVEGTYRAQISVAPGWQFTYSVDLDSHFKAAEAQSNRWDYGVGIGIANGRELVCWIEPHSATSPRHVDEMLAKLAWLKSKMGSPAFKKLKDLTDVTGRPFYWLRTLNGQCRITAHGKEAKLLARSGLRMPAQHLTLP